MSLAHLNNNAVISPMTPPIDVLSLSLSLSLHFFPLSLFHLPIFTMPSLIVTVGCANHSRLHTISTIPLQRPLLPPFSLPTIGSRLSQPILAPPHLLFMLHLWSSVPIQTMDLWRRSLLLGSDNATINTRSDFLAT